jgi:hypothetical protein
MTPDSQTALKIIVERAVRPVQATLTRKKKMREELLAHVRDVFDEELTSSHDEAIAVAKTAQRFGDAQEIAQQLQLGVSRWARPILWFDELMKPLPGDRPVVAAMRAARNFSIVLVGTMVFAMGLGIRATNAAEIAVLVSFIAPFAVAVALLSFLYVLLGILIRRDWFAATSKHSRLRLGTYLAASPVPVLLVPFVFALFVGHTLEVPAHIESVVPFLPLVPAALYFATRQYHEECEYAREWKSLQLD